MKDILTALAEVLQAGADECFSTPYNRDRCQRGAEYDAMAKKARELAEGES